MYLGYANEFKSGRAGSSYRQHCFAVRGTGGAPVREVEKSYLGWKYYKTVSITVIKYFPGTLIYH